MAFNIFVCVKQVPDTDQVKIDPRTGSLIRKGVPGVLNGDDCIALEEALRIKDDHDDVHIIAVTMGPQQAREILLEAIGKGADECIHINDRALADSDTFVTSTVLRAAIDKWSQAHGGYSLVLTGREASDGDTAQVGPQLAEKLGIPQITYVSQLTVSADLQTITASRKLDSAQEQVSVQIPCLLSVVRELNQPRYPHMANIFGDKKITDWTAADLGLDPEHLGLAGSPSKVMATFTMKKARGGTFIDGETGAEQAINLLTALKNKHII